MGTIPAYRSLLHPADLPGAAPLPTELLAALAWRTGLILIAASLLIWCKNDPVQNNLVIAASMYHDVEMPLWPEKVDLLLGR